MRVLMRRWVTAGFNPSCKDDATCRSIRGNRMSLVFWLSSAGVDVECAKSLAQILRGLDLPPHMSKRANTGVQRRGPFELSLYNYMYMYS